METPSKKDWGFSGAADFDAFLFVIIAPFALIVRWAADPLVIKRRTQLGWLVKAEVKGSPMQRVMNQF